VASALGSVPVGATVERQGGQEPGAGGGAVRQQPFVAGLVDGVEARVGRFDDHPVDAAARGPAVEFGQGPDPGLADVVAGADVEVDDHR